MDQQENSEYIPEPETAPEENIVAQVPEEEAEVPKKKRGTWWKCLIAGVLVVVLIAFGSGATAVYLRLYWGDEIKRNEQLVDQMEATIEQLRQEVQSNSFTGNGNSISGTSNTNGDGMTPAQVYAANVKSVVAISTQISTTNAFGQVSATASAGSGFVISENGYIVTNYHVVENAVSLKVITYDSQEYSARVVGFDSGNDMAVLKIEAQGLQPAKLGSSDDLIVGDQVVAIGNPLGELTSTLTVGYVSAKDRDVSTDGTVINMLQTDAAINSGNSGGPLFNMKGEVVGITTAKYSGTTSSGASIEGIGFAIPIDDVQKKIMDLYEYGHFTGASLGVMVQDVDRTTAEYYGIPMGAYVVRVVDGSGAHKAGVRAKDIIVAVGDHSVTGINELSRVLENFKGGDTTTITVWRSGVEVTLEITLDTKVSQ